MLIQIVFHFTKILPIPGSTDSLLRLIVLFIAPLGVYGYALAHPLVDSQRHLKKNRVAIFISLNFFWAIGFSYLLYATYGTDDLIEEGKFFLFAEMISAFRVFIYSLFIPIFFPKEDEEEVEE